MTTETYKPIYPGNAVAPLQAYGLPTPTFRTQGRPSGYPGDRSYQALLVAPGWLAVQKIGFARIQAAGTSWSFTVPSPDNRTDEPPRANISDLWVPEGARVYRAGFRTISRDLLPSGRSSGPNDTPIAETGIVGTTGEKLVMATATPAASVAGSIGATAITTDTNAGAFILASSTAPVASEGVQVNTGSAVAVTQSGGLTFRLYSVNAAGTAAGANVSCPLAGGAIVIGEVCYLVPAEFAEINAVNLPGLVTTGVRG